MEDDLSSVSFVSSISNTSSVHQPRPPGGPKPSSQSFHRSSKASGKVARSPYLASTPFPSKKQRPHSRDGSSCNGRTSRRKVPAAWKELPSGSSVSTFMQSLVKTPGVPNSRWTSSLHTSRRHPYLTSPARKQAPRAPPQVPAMTNSVSGQMDAGELRDEVVQLRRDLNAMKKERDVAKAQQVRLSGEMKRKDKQIQDLISTGHVSTRDATRSLVKQTSSAQPVSSGGGGALVASLRQQVHSLEVALRGKEEEMAALKSGLSASRLREMEIQTDTYYREICRLQHHLDDQDGGQMEVTPRSSREAHIKLKALNQATVKMATQIESLEEDNRILRKRIGELESGVPAPSGLNAGVHGDIRDHFQDYSRAQMLSALVEYDIRCVEFQKRIESSQEGKSKARLLYEQRIGELRNELAESCDRASYLETQVNTSHNNENKYKNVIHRLKDDRTHYRNAAEHTQKELQTVQDHLGREEMTREEVAKELQAVRDEYHKEMLAVSHARKLAQKPSKIFTPDREKKNAAASTIQRTWRRRQAVVKQERYQRENEEAIVALQSALRAHLVRKRMLSLQSPQDSGGRSMEGVDGESVNSDDAVEMIQSALRGHFTRQMILQDLQPNRFEEAANVDVGEKMHSKENLTSSLLRYTPPPQIDAAKPTPLPSRKEPRSKRACQLLNSSQTTDTRSDEDEDYQHIHSRSYLKLSSSTESDPHDPDQHMLLDEL